MGFQITPLKRSDYRHLFAMSDQQLAAIGSRRVTVESPDATPCRISLVDAAVGERVILTNYQHQTGDTPFKASHAIFVRENAKDAVFAANRVPQMFRSRTLAIRGFDRDHMMIEAELCDGNLAEDVATRLLENSKVEYLHLHFAAAGCFAARANRI